MKKTRAFALLLIVALLATVLPAFGETVVVESSDQAGTQPGIELQTDGTDAEETPGDLSDELLAQGDDDAASNAAEDVLQPNVAPSQEHFTLYCAPDELVGNDILFAGYVDLLFGKKDSFGLKPNGVAGDRLTGATAKVYQYLLKQIKAVAAGEISSTEFLIPESVAAYSDLDELCENYARIIHALLADCPYHLFWYDKTVVTEFGYNGGFYFRFPVAKEYAAGTYLTKASKISSVQAAVQNAKDVVEQVKKATDYQKLLAYKDYICNAVTYDQSALDDPNRAYGNPWQVIWVFDGNSKTNVVCEGYAKAFQYLFDLTKFKSKLRCITVTGAVPRGAHMWNIVTMEDGKNYAVDPTFCDTGSQVFLAGAEMRDNGSGFTVDGRLNYAYGSDTLGIYPASALKLATKNYDTKFTRIAIDQGESATLYMGNKLKLSTTLTPSNAKVKLKWSTSDKKVAKVSQKGVVEPKKAGKADITVTTSDGASATITVNVIDADSIVLKWKNGEKWEELADGAIVNIKKGKSLTLEVAASPAGVKPSLKWTSSKTGKVKVTKGKVTLTKKAKVGTKAKITVKTKNHLSAFVVVKVVNK